jgi:hypothetical protein
VFSNLVQSEYGEWELGIRRTSGCEVISEEPAPCGLYLCLAAVPHFAPEEAQTPPQHRWRDVISLSWSFNHVRKYFYLFIDIG